MSESNTNRVFVGNLSWNTTDQSLYDVFSKGGESVIEAKVMFDRFTGRSRGFGFVTFSNAKNAAAAKSRLNGAEVDGRCIQVSYAQSSYTTHTTSEGTAASSKTDTMPVRKVTSPGKSAPRPEEMAAGPRTEETSSGEGAAGTETETKSNGGWTCIVM